MLQNKKPSVLVIADINPRFENDLRYVFIHDYLRCLVPHCEVKLLSISLLADKGLIGSKGIKRRIIHEKVEVTNFSVTNKKPNLFLKPFYYLYWFYKSYQLGKSYKDIDLVHAHSAILHGTLAFLISRKLKAKLVFTEHTGPFANVIRSPIRKLWAKFSMQKADTVLCVSHHLKNEILENKIRPKKLIVSYNPVDTELFKIKENNPKENYKNILYAGRLDDFKGGYRALLAFQKIASKYTDWTLTIIGGGHDFNLIKTAVESDPMIAQRVFLRGAQPKQEIAREMQQAAFFLFPSSHESFGIVIAEAMASGLPVIIGNKAAPKEYVSHEMGIITDPNDIDEISHAAEVMIDNLSIYQSSKIRQHIVNYFGLENFGTKLAGIYKDVLLNKE